MMRKYTSIMAAVAIICMASVSCEKEGKKTQKIYYQFDNEIAVDANGTEVIRYEFKYDEQGNKVWERWFDSNYNVSNDNSYDNQGRIVKLLSYDEEDGKHSLCYIEEFSYGPNYRILLSKDGDGSLIQKDSTVYDANGNVIQYNVFYVDNESGELYQDYEADITNDQYGNIIKTVYTCPYDPDYYFEQRIQYEYKTFGEWTQYTTKEVKYSWDGKDFLWDSRTSYEYDQNGNNIREVVYSADDYGELQLSQENAYTVDMNLFTDSTYGTDYVPTQPNCYKTRKTYDGEGNLMLTHTFKYSEHHKGELK